MPSHKNRLFFSRDPFFLFKTYSDEWNSIRYLHNFGTGLAMDVVSPRYLVGHLSKGQIVRLFPGR